MSNDEKSGEYTLCFSKSPDKIFSDWHTNSEVMSMSKKKGSDKVKNTSDKVHVRSSANVGSMENQNQNHNTQKEALGPNTKR
jgi:hypothetical protein